MRESQTESAKMMMKAVGDRRAWSVPVDKATMVGLDISVGQDVVRALDDAGVKLSVAVWAQLPDYVDWRLVLAGPGFDAVGLEGWYRLLHNALAQAGFPPSNRPLTRIFPMSDPFVKALRRIYAKYKDITDGNRIGGRMIGDRFIEDGYIYRIT
jgi:hypothetical protein